MERKVYLEGNGLLLAAYSPEEDDLDSWRCWQDEDTRRGYNIRYAVPFEEYRQKSWRQRFVGTVLRQKDLVPIGLLMVSPEDAPPDLAIMIYPKFRGQGFGRAAFSLGVRYCFEVLRLEWVYAGCYEGNVRSLKMLAGCGFVRHPEGDGQESHYQTGAPIIQLDFVKYRRQQEPEDKNGNDTD